MSTKQLAEYASTLSYADLDPSVVQAAKRAILDALGVACAGVQTKHGKIAQEYAAEVSKVDEASLIGSPYRTAAPQAAFANTIAGRADTFDDVHEQGITHPGCAVIFSSLAAAEKQGASGKDLIAAVTVGYDLALRVAMASAPSHYERGFHTTGTTNVFGAAAGAGRIFGLTPEKMAMALGLAGDQSASLRQYQIDGSVANSAIHAGNAAHNGVASALLAGKGYPASPQILEGKWGFLETFCPEYNPEILTAGLGKRFMVSETSFKLYPSCRYIHGGLDAMLRAARPAGVHAQEVERLTIRTFEAAQVECDRPDFSTVLQAQFSLQYNLAVALLRGTVSLADFEPGRLADPEVTDLASRIQIEHDPALDEEYPEKWPYIATFVLSGGRSVEARVDYPPGSAKNPVAEADLLAKYQALSEPVLGEAAARLAEQVLQLEQVGDVRQLRPLLQNQPVEVSG